MDDDDGPQQSPPQQGGREWQNQWEESAGSPGVKSTMPLFAPDRTERPPMPSAFLQDDEFGVPLVTTKKSSSSFGAYPLD